MPLFTDDLKYHKRKEERKEGREREEGGRETDKEEKRRRQAGKNPSALFVLNAEYEMQTKPTATKAHLQHIELSASSS